MKDSLKSLVIELARLSGVSGSEGAVVARVKEIMGSLCDEIMVDRMGNVIATRRGRDRGPSLMLAAHTDEIGAVVRSVEKDGFLRLDRIGGALDSLLVGRKVQVSGRYFGVIGVKPGHLQTPEEQRQVKGFGELYVDVGADSDGEVAGMGIRIGDPINWISDLDEFTTKPDRLCGKGVDDRYGCAALIQLFKNLSGRELDGTVHAVFTVQEEVGLRGAKMAAYRLSPDCAIAIDTIPAGDTPDVDFTRELPVALGKGPVIPIIGGAPGRGYIMHNGMKQLLIDVAEKDSIPCQLAIFSTSTTDAASIHLERGGIPTGGIGLPRRFSHSPVETIDLEDGVNTVKVLQGIVSRQAEMARYLEFV